VTAASRTGEARTSGSTTPADSTPGGAFGRTEFVELPLIKGVKVRRGVAFNAALRAEDLSLRTSIGDVRVSCTSKGRNSSTNANFEYK
jgi:hypothetical protein